MKKVHLLSCTALLSLFVIAFSSCSKDTVSENKVKNGLVNSNKPGQTVQADVNELPGSIQAQIRPEFWSMAVYVYSSTFTSGDYLPDENGLVTIPDLAPGTYTLVLHPYNDNSDLPEVTLTDIEVLSDEVTYLEKVPL